MLVVQRLRTIAGVSALLSFGGGACATVVWNESISGDLSNNQAAPTAVTMASGTNSIIGSCGGADTRDFVTLHVPAGLQLSSVVLFSYVSTDAQGFTGFQVGTAFVGSVNSPGSYAGYSHFGTGAQNGTLPATNLVGVNILPLMADTTNVAIGATGFSIPLPAGDYTFDIQQTGAANTAYQFDFGVTSVPAPGAAGTALLGAAFIAARRRRGSR